MLFHRASCYEIFYNSWSILAAFSRGFYARSAMQKRRRSPGDKLDLSIQIVTTFIFFSPIMGTKVVAAECFRQWTRTAIALDIGILIVGLVL